MIAPNNRTPRHLVIQGLVSSMMLTFWLGFSVLFAQSDTNNHASANNSPASISATNRDFPSVGMSRRINDLILPGSELTTKPIDDKSPIVLRIVDSRVHGTAFRYDLVYYGLEPGNYDLVDYLARVDGSDTDDLPAIDVQIDSVLPDGQIVPNELDQGERPRIGGYRLAVWIIGSLWLVGLLLLIFWPRTKLEVQKLESETPKSLADRLRPMVESALHGKLSNSEKAELERLLLAYWHDKLDLGNLPPATAIQRMRQDADAGHLITVLEEWLHSPDQAADVDVNKLLEPYRHVTATY